MENNERKIGIYGAFDRYNYGDLLFPIILEHYFAECAANFETKFAITYLGMVDADMTAYGGKATLKFDDVARSSYTNQDYIVVAGGEALHSSIERLYLDLSPNLATYCYRKIMRKLFGRTAAIKKAQKALNLSAEFPYVLDNKGLEYPKVIYNSVGGCSLLEAPELPYIRDVCEQAVYLSVRDELTLSALSGQKATLAADTAFLMSEIFSISELRTRCSANIVEKLQEEYICFQVKWKVYKNNKNLILAQLRELIALSNRKIILLPIGCCANHDDIYALKSIHKKLKKDTVLLDGLNIYEIMYTIASSSFFIGTSLHGNITASSFLVPHIGFGSEIKKLDGYFSTWEALADNRCVAVGDVAEHYVVMSAVSADIHNKIRARAVKSAGDSMRRICDMIYNEST